MKYICLVYHDGSQLDDITDQDFEEIFRGCGRWVGELGAENHVFSAGLQSTSTAATIRARDGKVAVTDGPFAETKEWLGGFTVLEANSMDEAIEKASKLAATSRSTIEVRPIIDEDAELKDPVDQRIDRIRRRMKVSL